jgi:hypothetical protein
MAGQSWLINIVPSGSSVAFNPDVFGVAPGSPLQAQVNDLICWNNQTESAQQVVVSNVVSGLPDETFDADSWKSTTAYQIQNPKKAPFPYTIDYTCAGQTGHITVIA